MSIYPLIYILTLALASTSPFEYADHQLATNPLAKESTFPKSQNSTSTEKLLGVGNDGIVRSVITKDNGAGNEHTLSNTLNLQPGDTVEISSDGQVASVYQNDQSLLGEFISPTMTINGEEIPGKFAFLDGNLLTTFSDNTELPFGCWRGTAAKWTWRAAAGLICGAAGVISAPGGFACGLGAAGAEDAMNIDGRAC